MLSVEGRLLTPEGAPAAGMTVRAMSDAASDPIVESVTSADGRFQIALFTDGVFHLGFAGDERYPATTLTDSGLRQGDFRDDARSFYRFFGDHHFAVGDLRLVQGVPLTGSIDVSGMTSPRELEIVVANESVSSSGETAWTRFRYRTAVANGSNAWSVRVAPGDYIVKASVEGTRFVQYFGGGTSFADAHRITVGSSGAAGISFDLDAAPGSVSGLITDAAGLPCAQVHLQVLDAGGVPSGNETITDSDGRYGFGDLEAGLHEIVGARFPSCESAEGPSTVVVDGSAPVVADFVWQREEGIAATVTFAGGSAGAYFPVYVYRAGGEYVRHLYTDHTGRVEISLDPGVYRVGTQQWGIKGLQTWAATDVTVVEGVTTSVDLTDVIGAARFGGESRYDTAVAITRSHFDPGVERLYLANGVGLSDALAAAPVAGAGGNPILLTQRASIPGSTWTELRRLRPKEIVLLGGAGAIDESLVPRIADIAGIPIGKVLRWAGADRYATAAAISQSAFPDGADTVYIANGTAFADALAVAPVAGADSDPVLLVSAASVPESTESELERLSPSRVVVLGGTGVVSAAVAAKLGSIVGGANVERWAGADRYETAAAIAAANFPEGVETVFVASGNGLVDALAAAPAAARDGAPLLLMRHGAIPPAVEAILPDLGASSYVLFGDSGVLADALFARLRDLAH